MKLKTRIYGFDDAAEKLESLPDKIERKIGIKAIRAGAWLIINAARQNLQRLGAVKTGNLRKSIGLKTKKAKTHLIGVTIGARIDGEHSGQHAHLVEFGTSPHVIRSRKLMSDGSTVYGHIVTHPGSRPKPFLRPAIDTNEDAVLLKVGSVVKSEIEQLT